MNHSTVRSHIDRPFGTKYEEGRVTLSHGFVPRQLTPQHLSPQYRPWDELAAQLPELFYAKSPRQEMERLPLLSAERGQLSDEELPRAGVVLSTLAHAYWRFGARRFFGARTTEVSSDLPRAIAQPWAEVSHRLGRHNPGQPYQNFYDLFLANYRYRRGVDPSAAPLVGNIEVLVPTFNNEAEHIFYTSFVEMHFHFSAVPRLVCELQEAMAVDDLTSVVASFEAIRQCLARATSTWRKIGTQPNKPHFCDPVIWSKTVAILGVAAAGCPRGGTSGACAPAIYLFDSLVGRKNYQSDYGRYLQRDAAPLVPRPVLELGRVVAEMDVSRFVTERPADKVLTDSWQALQQAYCGSGGWLGKHVSKAFSYLCTSTLVGRNASVSGHERYSARQTWERAASALDESRKERSRNATGCPFAAQARAEAAAPAVPAGKELKAACPRDSQSPTKSVPGQSVPAASACQRTMSYSDVVRAVCSGQLLVIVQGMVYDLSEYTQRHPGGEAVLRAYAGQQATEVFMQQHGHNTVAVRRQLRSMATARLRPHLRSRNWLVQFAAKLLRVRHALLAQYDHGMGKSPALKLYSDEHAHLQMLVDYLPTALGALGGRFSTLLLRSTALRAEVAASQWLSDAEDYRRPLNSRQCRLVDRRITVLRRADLGLVKRLLAAAVRGLDSSDKSSQLLVLLRLEATRALEQYLAVLRRETASMRGTGAASPRVVRGAPGEKIVHLPSLA